MLAETHPLFVAECFLLDLFKEANPKHYIEFCGIASKERMAAGGIERKVLVEACPIEGLEKSFDFSIADQLVHWNRQGYDIYFGVCPREVMPRTPRGAVTRANDTVVTQAVCAWVDCDHPMHEETIRAFEKDFKPTYWVRTGRGSHWYFKYPAPKDAEAAKIESNTLARILNGDHTSDKSRLLRVPGTTNCKDWPKRKPCEMYEINADAIFHGIPERLIPKTQSDLKKADQIGLVARDDVRDANEFIKTLPQELRNAILFGYEHAGPYKANLQKENDRSEIDFRIIKDLFKRGAPDRLIREIFLNAEYGISGKTLDESKRGNSENYLKRTLDEARLKAEIEMSYQEEFYGEELPFISVDDLKKAQQLQFCIERLLTVAGFMFISGPAKIGKSLMVEDLIMLLAGAQGKFLERFEVKMPGTVAYMQAEVQAPSLRHRLHRIATSRNNQWDKLPHPMHFFNKPLDLGNHRNLITLEKTLKKIGARYLVIDPLARYHHMNENRQGDMSRVLSGIERCSRNAGCIGTVIIHHHGKPPSDGEAREGLHTIRGSSVIGDWGNAHIILQGKRNERTEEKYVRVTFELRDCEEPVPMELMRDKETLRFFPYNEEANNESEVRRILADNAGLPDDELIARVSGTLSISKNKAAKIIQTVRIKDRQNREGHSDGTPAKKDPSSKKIPSPVFYAPALDDDDDDDDDDSSSYESAQS